MSIKHKIQAWQALFKRYQEVWLYFWRQRHEITLPEFKAHEADFLPAALSIQAKPVSPAGRWVAKILILLILVLLAWSVFSKIDIIVNASGKIIPSGYSKTIASIEVASVRALYVQEGQSVKADELLIELDSRATDSDREKAEGEKQNAWLQAERSRALLTALDTGKPPKLDQPERWHEAQEQLSDQWRDYQAKIIRLDGEIRRYSNAIPLSAQRARDYAALAKTNDVSQHAWLEKEQAHIDLQGQLADAKNQKFALTADARKNAREALNEANRITAASDQDERKALAHGDLLKITSPVDGTVQQLTIHTVGGVVSAAQPLMQIVPKQAIVEMEAFMENKDIGFVQAEQDAQVKIDAFEYTKYGTIPAKVSHVSQDAIQDEKKGLIYAVKVTLLQSTMTVDGRQVALSPGMSGSVEIKTGSRHVIEYVMAPLLQHGRESLNER
jgi:hemolysin D